MKETLNLIFAVLIQPLVDAIKENTAAIIGKTCSGSTAEAPAKPEKPAKPAKPEKPAPAPAPAHEGSGGEATGDEVTVEDLIAYAKSLDDSAKAKVKTGLKKNFGVESFPELKTGADRAKVLEKLKSLGATDTRTPAPAADGDEW